MRGKCLKLPVKIETSQDFIIRLTLITVFISLLMGLTPRDDDLYLGRSQ